MKKTLTFVIVFVCLLGYSQEIVTKNNLFGWSVSNEIVIPIEYDSIKMENEFIFALKDSRYVIYNGKKRKIKSDVKKVYSINPNLLQIIDAQNKMFFIDSTGAKVENKQQINNVIHNLAYEINDSNNEIYLKAGIGKKGRDTLSNIENTFIIPKKMKAIVLMNNNKLNYIINNTFHENLSQDLVVVKKRKKYGVWNFSQNKLILPFKFDKIEAYNSYLYLEKKGLATFYPYVGIEPKYKKLIPYIEYFARFKTVDGREGWVDRKGKEYFDE